MKILYVEDEVAHVLLAQRTLEENLQHEFTLVHAETIKQALSVLDAQTDIDLILSDLRLPDGTGLDLLTKVRERESPPAVVLVTGQGDQEVAVAALKAGAADYLVKQSDYLHRLPIVISNAVAQNRYLREQAALRAAEIKYQSLVEQISAVVFLDDINETETTLYMSPRIEELTGYSSEEWLADPEIWRKCIHPDDQERIFREFEKSHKYGTSFAEEYRLIRRDGRTVWVKEDTNLIRDNDGNPSYWQGLLLDITKEKENEVALQRQVQELSVLHSVAIAGTESYSEDEIIEKVTRITGQLYPEVCGILQLNEKGDMLTPHSSYLGADISNWRNGYPITRGITGKAVLLGKTIRSGDITKEAEYIEIASNIRSELCVPIRVNEHIIGVLNVESRKADAFEESDERILNTIAGGLGIALEKLRLFKEEQQRRQEAETLRRAATVLSSSLDPDTVSREILTALKQIILFNSGSVFLQEGNKLRIAMAEGYYHSEQLKNLTFPEDDEYYQVAKITRQPIIVEDVQKDSRFKYWGDSTSIRGWMVVPLISRGRVIGAISLDSLQPGAFNKNIGNTVMAFAYQAAAAIENARLFESEQGRRREAETLRLAATAISSTLDLNSVMEDILKALKQVIDFDSASVFLHEGDWLRLAVCQGFAGPDTLINKKFPANDPLLLKIRETRRPIIIEDVQKNPLFKNWGNTQNIHGWMATPLLNRGRVIGYITLDNYKPAAYDESNIETAMAFAYQAAAAIENARLYDETQRRLSELETINRLSASLRTTQPVDEMLNILLNETLNLIQTEHGLIWLYDSAEDHLVQRAARGELAHLKNRSLKISESHVIGQTFLSGKVHISSSSISDSSANVESRDNKAADMRAACIPIQSTAGTMGVLMIGVDDAHQITDQINLLTTMAEIAGNSIHRAQLLEHSREQIQRLTTLRDIDSAIASSFDLRLTLNILMDQTMKHLGVHAIDITLYHPDLQTITYLGGLGFQFSSATRPQVRIGEGLAGRVIIMHKTLHITDLQNSPEIKNEPLLKREGFVTYIGIPLIVKGQIKGVFEVFHRAPLSPTPDWMEFLHTLAGQAAIAIDNSQLFENLQRSNQELIQAYDTTLEGWARALELRDRETEGHTRRVTELTLRLAEYMGISESEMVNIHRGVLLHDIGKMGVPDHILKKAGKLDANEWQEMRQHPVYAYNLLSPISYLRGALDIPYSHHEHWDGSGYPRGLKAEQIPLAARIFSVVDIWDALLSDRPYRKAWSQDKVIEYLKDIAGTHLDPRIVETFLRMIVEDESATYISRPSI